MVVVSGSWVKNVATYPTPTSADDMVISTLAVKMSAKAVLICRPNSHPFQERTLCLDQPIKVGRSVARARASAANAIFDCKVLSRHHALLWYDNGKFYLQDTKSSNGTFVNNNRLSSSESSEPHEVCSGDIVQFGVDVVENNRKVTHGCIVATLKLYLPDGKEAKASPSIMETNRHGIVPLDELYKLNQIIREASQREQCLESKLIALQHVVEETRRSADESWQAYIGEERLLSRVSILESQLVQAGKSWGDDRLREELSKLQEDRSAYQVAAKETLQKLHSERLEAVADASEQQRARCAAEQEAGLAREQLIQVQCELQEIAQQLSEEQRRSDEDRIHLEQKERELQARLDSEMQTVLELKLKLEHIKSSNPLQELLPLQELEKFSLIYDDDCKSKEALLAENEGCDNIESELNRTNSFMEPQQKHINLTVVPVAEQSDSNGLEIDSDTMDSTVDMSIASTATLIRESSSSNSDENGDEKESVSSEESIKQIEDMPRKSNSETPEKHVRFRDRLEPDVIQIDSKTLKYQFQTAQIELKKQIEQLDQTVNANKSKIAALESVLEQEKELNIAKTEECEQLNRELVFSQQKLKESCNEAQQLRDNISRFGKEPSEYAKESGDVAAEQSNNIISYCNAVNLEQLEEELVLLKERYAQMNDEKLLLNKNLVAIHERYNTLQNRSYNTMFWYVAPLVIMVLYLLTSSMFS